MDKEKVIEIFDNAKELVWTDDDEYTVGYNNGLEAGKGIALTLLKEQEPIEPVDDGHGSLICGNQGYECGCVGRYDLTIKVVEKYCNFCPECGRKVKWE